MRIPHLNMCCCGCKLETGALVIGWLSMIGSILGLIFSILALTIPQDPNSEYIRKDNIDTSFFLSAGTAFCLAIILLVGTNKRNDKYLHTWVVINVYVTCLYIASYTGNAIIFMIAGGVVIGVLILLFGSLSCLLQLYFICVVHNLRRQITSEKLNKANYPVAQNLLSMA